ncbi:MAG: DUF222 domain-containing protein, partial [Ilumatobacter sp.]|nr:DUF222 domain-containing protein [Ilumatobacter sp.]
MIATGVADRVGSSPEAAVNTITGFLNAQHAELVDVVIGLLARPSEWQGEGVWTMQQWLAWRCGVSRATANQIVDIAKRADDLPVSMAAFRRGELTLDQMAAVARRAPWWTDEQTCTLAKMMTVSQLQSNLRRYRFPDLDADGREIRDEPADGAADPTAASDEEAADGTLNTTEAAGTGDTESTAPSAADVVDETCWFTFGDDGVFRLSLTADFDTGHIVQSALTEARDRLFQDGQHDVDWVDALREVSQRSLDAVPDPARRSRFRTNLHLDTDRTMTDAARCRVPDSVRRHLTCDGLLSPVFVASGIPISVGRTQRIVPDRTRVIVERRDAHRCRVPGCTARAWLEVHHIVHWEDLGETETWNLLLLCPLHHRLHHRGALGITGNADLPDGADGAV